MKINLGDIFFFVIFFVFSFIFGVFTHGLITGIIFFLILIFATSLSWGYCLLIAFFLAGISNMTFNFRVFLESLIVEVEGKKGYTKFFSKFIKLQENGEKTRSSVPIEINSKKYRVVEFARYSFDPRAKNKNDLKGFMIFDDETEKEVKNEVLQKEILATYLFWRHIYFNNDMLGEIQLKPQSKKFFKEHLKFQEKFKIQIDKRKYEGYPKEDFKNEDFIPILKKLDDEVNKQYPFVKEKIGIELDIFDSLYNLFTKPSDKLYGNLIEKIDKISELSSKENRFWSERVTTWNNLSKHYNLQIDNLPNPNFKRAGVYALIDIIKYLISKKEPIITEDTLKEIIKESSKIPRKKLLKFLNNYFVLHKFGVDAIKRNIEINKKFREIAESYKRMNNSPPIEKIRSLEK